MELKTLKDLERKSEWLFEGVDVVVKEEIKQEAIKWVKYDLKNIDNNPLLEVEKIISLQLIERWMERLNITEDYLT